MTQRVSLEDLYFAIEWLSLNEGPEGEAEGCKRVAVWLADKVSKRERDIVVKRVAETTGRPVAEVWKFIKGQKT